MAKPSRTPRQPQTEAPARSVRIAKERADRINALWEAAHLLLSHTTSGDGPMVTTLDSESTESASTHVDEVLLYTETAVQLLKMAQGMVYARESLAQERERGEP